MSAERLNRSVFTTMNGRLTIGFDPRFRKQRIIQSEVFSFKSIRFEFSREIVTRNIGCSFSNFFLTISMNQGKIQFFYS